MNIKTPDDGVLAPGLLHSPQSPMGVGGGLCADRQQEERHPIPVPEHQDEFPTLYRQQFEHIRRLEHALEMEQAATEQLRSFNRLKQNFLSNVSHEFRTPITAIHGYLSLLDQGAFGVLSPEQADAVHVSLRNIDRLSRLVSDVLDFSSLARGQFLLQGEPVEIATVLEDAVQRVAEPIADKAITLRRDIASRLGRVLGDEEKLCQVVAHLLENAVKFSESGKEVLLAAHRSGHHVVIDVLDRGIGMTPQQLAHVFTPFVQGESGLSRRFGGLGMGLALIQNLIALHGGEIRITSHHGKGTRVTIKLPQMSSA